MKIFGKCWFVYQGLYIIIYTIFFYTNCIFFLFRHILVATFNNWQSVMSLIYLIKGDNLLHWRETSVSYLSLSLSAIFTKGDNSLLFPRNSGTFTCSNPCTYWEKFCITGPSNDLLRACTRSHADLLRVSTSEKEKSHLKL